MLQVRNLPDELHAALSERARAQGVSMSDYVTEVLRRELSKPTVAEWVASQRELGTHKVDVRWAVAEARHELDEGE